MLFGPARREDLARWRRIHSDFKDKLIPNRKSAEDVIKYLSEKYDLSPAEDPKLSKVVIGNAKNSAFWQQKLEGREPEPVCFFIENEGAGRDIYSSREDVWEDMDAPVFIGIDKISGMIHVEGSCRLYDEIYAFQGIDKYDIENCARVADYIECIKKFDKEYYEKLAE